MRPRKASWEVVLTLVARSEGLDEGQAEQLLAGAPVLQHRLVQAFGCSTEAAADALRGWLAWRGLIDRTAPSMQRAA